MDKVIEGNKIIAEFMGIDVYETYEKVQLVPIDKLNRYFLSGQGKYHSSWDWLMPAWKKFYNEIFLSEWYKDSYDEQSNKEFECLEYSITTANIEGAFKHFTNILEWYNNQNK